VDVRAAAAVVVVGSFGAYLAVLLWDRRRSAAAFYVPGRRHSPLAGGVAIATGWISAASFLSLGGLCALSSRQGTAYLVGWTGGFVLLAVLVAPALRRAGRHTVPGYLGERFASRGVRVVAAACALLVTVTYLAAQLRGAAVVLARLLEVPVGAAVAAAAVLVLLHAALGRMRTLTAGHVAQYLVLAGAYLALGGALLHALTGEALPQRALFAHLSTAGAALLGAEPGAALLPALARRAAAAGLGPAPETARTVADRVAVTLALMAGTAGLPHVLRRFFTVPRRAEARTTVAWGLVFVVVLYSAVPAVSLAVRAVLVATVDGAPRDAPPAWALAWAPTGLVRAEPGEGPLRLASTGSGRKPGRSFAVDPDVLVLAAPEALGLSPWIVALAAAGALAAAVSSAAGLVLAAAASVAQDLAPPGRTDRAAARAGLLAGVAAAAVAAGLALRPPGSVVQLVALAFGVAAAAFFPVLVAGAFWPRVTRRGALCGMAAGAAFTVGYVHWFRFAHPELDLPAAYWLGISPEGIGAVGVALGAVVLVAVSLLWPAPRAAPERA
jgi:cation/acetate symporter